MLILEEAAYISAEVIQEIIVPVLNVNNSCIVAISTLGKKPSNMFAQMIRSELFFVHQVTYICEPCLKLGVQEVCKHNRAFVPPWIGDNSELVHSLFDGKQEKMMRETLGVLDDQGPNCFTERSVLKMMTDPRVTLYEPVRYVYIVIDPSGGSDIPDKRSSDFCLVSICAPNTTIVGMEAIDVVASEDYEQIVVKHMNLIRLKPMFQNCTFVIDAESGCGYVAGDLEVLIRRNFQRVVCMSDFTNRKPGTLTTNQAKKEMMEMTRSLLDAGEVRMMADFVSCHACIPDMLKEFQNQMLNFERIVLVSKSIRTGNTVKYSGKQHGRDDMAQTLQRAVRARFRFLFGKEYQRYHI